ncbi:vitamin B12 transporter [Roseovarius nanhaiticus]|uniref:Vitamin B12 transporter n=1 Tax=Roseovarius nanhaiticus TaxID=573024 RepID=A0A1N7GE70_9RHOB|nr:TonB-dependent receptor [Roseovarius nanhaiticus]SEK29173.1 vitamin B12 transporter [Roseovarius nanhaiticus]SIS10776.1 vitamin B12 transporter [Roseovarius nanhaiticus]
MKRILLTSTILTGALAQSAAAQQTFDLGTIVFSAAAQPIEKLRFGASVEVLGDGEPVGEDGDVELKSSLQRLPGITAEQNGPPGTTTNVSIRGAQERYTSVYVDGIKVNDPSSTSGQYGNFGGFSVAGINRVEVLKGSQSALYGGSAIAGVIDISTLPDLDGPLGTQQQAEIMFGSYGTFASSYAFSRTFDRLSLSFGISHAESDGFSAGDEARGNTEDDGYSSDRLSFGVAYQASEAVRIGFNGFYSEGRAEFDEGTGVGPVDGTPGDELGKRVERGLRLFTDIDQGGAWTHQASVSYFDVDRRQSSGTVAPGSFSAFSSRFEGERRRLEWQSNANISDQLDLSLGADYEKLTSKSTSIPGGSASTENIGLFAEAIYSPRDDLDVVATLRYDDNSQFGDKTTGRVAVSYRATDALTIRGAVANGFRPPVPSELFSSFPDPLYPYQGNPNLAPEESQSAEIGFDLALTSNTEISTTLFYKGIENLVQFAPCPVTIDFVLFSCDPGTFSTVRNTPGTTNYQGLEFELRHEFSDRLEATLAYTYLDAQTSAGALLARVAKHEIYASLDAALSNRVNGRLGVTHVADRAPDSSPAQALADYTVVDLGFVYEISEDATAYVTLQNVFDEQYQQIAGYGTSGRAVFLGLRASF